MADDPAGAASAQAPAAPDTTPSAPAPVSAERAASDTGDFGAFDRAHVAKRQGKTVPAADPASAARAETSEPSGEGDGDPTADRSLTRRQRQDAVANYKEQQAILYQRVRDLESRLARPGTPADAGPAGAPPPTGQPPAQPTAKERVARYLALPDAPKIDDFDTYPEYTAAQTLFLQDKLGAEQAAVRGREQAQVQRHQALVARDATFRERLTAAKTADPEFVGALSEEAKSLGGIDHARRSGVAPGPVHIIGELVYDSPQAVAFLRHISANPDALRALVTPPESVLRVPPQWRAKAHIDHLVTEFRRLEGRLAYEESLGARDSAPSETPPPLTSVSAAPPPPPTLGKAGRSTDPIRSALARNDFAAFDQAEMDKRRRQRAGGRAG
jgi:hypothetical protein